MPSARDCHGSRPPEGQLASKGEDFDILCERVHRPTDFFEQRERFRRWRAKSIRFKVALEQALFEVRYLLKVDHAPEHRAVVFGLEQAQQVNDRLVSAIRRHRDSFPYDDEPSEQDEALWAELPAS